MKKIIAVIAMAAVFATGFAVSASKVAANDPAEPLMIVKVAESGSYANDPAEPLM